MNFVHHTEIDKFRHPVLHADLWLLLYQNNDPIVDFELISKKVPPFN